MLPLTDGAEYKLFGTKDAFFEEVHIPLYT